MTEPAKLADGDSGWVSIDALGEQPEAKALPPVVDEATLQSSRALMNRLRRGGLVVSGQSSKSSQAELKSAAKKPSVSSARRATLPQSDLRVNRILQTAGQDDNAGVITIPSLDQELPPIVEAPLVQSLLDANPSQLAMTPQTSPGHVSMKQLKKDARQAKRRARLSRAGGGLIEFYDPDLDRLDVDDYDRTILLVSDSGATPQSQSTTEDDAEDGRSLKLFSRKITDIKPTLEYAWGAEDDSKLPDDFYSKMDKGEYVARDAPRTILQWEPTNLWYYPLYFEDPALERYGHTRRPWLQPIVSSGRFFGQVATLPYQMTLHPPKSKEFALGYYQPGEWAPKKRYRIPFNEEATAVQFLWITGLVLLIP